jgi:hypothetical protein
MSIFLHQYSSLTNTFNIFYRVCPLFIQRPTDKPFETVKVRNKTIAIYSEPETNIVTNNDQQNPQNVVNKTEEAFIEFTSLTGSERVIPAALKEMPEAPAGSPRIR